MGIMNVGEQPTKIEFKQSANTLFNFMPRFEFLEKALIEKAMFPRFYEENINYLGLSFGDEQVERVAFPMLCFCDIKLHSLSDHMDGTTGNDGYGNFGLGLDKSWCIEKGIQPVDYINDKSSECESLSKVLNMGTDLLYSEEFEEEHNNFFDYLLEKITFTKPLYGEMKKGERNIQKNFHDEREWRFVPEPLENSELDFFYNNVTKPNHMNNAFLNNYSDTLNLYDEYLLKIESDAINYIFVKDEEYLEKLLKIISKHYDLEEAMRLSSKVVVYDKIRRDW